MSCGQDLVRIDPDVFERGTQRIEETYKDPTAGQRTWDSMIRMLGRDGIDDYRR